MIPKQFYVQADQQTSNFVVKVINARDNSVVKMYTFPGKIVSHPVLSGDIVNLTYKSVTKKYLVLINLKTKQKREKIIQ
jgi:hypothetical protein